MLRLFGTPDFQGAPIPLERSTVLVAILVLAGDWVSRESLMALLWSDAPLEVTQVRLRQLLRRAQQFDFCAGLQIERSRLCYQSDSDLQQFKKAYEAQHWLEASKLYRGEFLKGLVVADAPELETWLQTEREVLRQWFVQAVLFSAQHLPDSEAFLMFLAAVQLEPLELELVRVALERGVSDLVFAKQIFTLHQQALQVLSETPSSEIKNLLAWAEQSVQKALRVIPDLQDSLIGRQDELEQIEAFYLQGRRLVTLLGVGGIGKTRLASEIAFRSGFLDGVVFVSLVAVSKAEDLYSAILEALSAVVGADSRLQLFGLLKPKELLLVLDNFEHLIAAAPMVADLLESASKLRILITSREALHLTSEQLLEITGFPLPDDLFPLESQETVLLFERHAKRGGLRFVWRSNDLELMQRIHRAVFGSPLGVSLAAGLLRVLTLEQIASELERNLTILSAQQNSDLPLRHRSLEAVFQTSWKLLTSQEQQVLARLSILNAGFELELVKHLTGASQELLLHLAGKSLISRRGQRLYIHEAIRQYAQVYLSETERNQSLELLLVWVFDLAKIAREQTGETKEFEAYKAVNDEYDHLRLAAEWGVIHQPLQVAQILIYLNRFFAQRGYTQDKLAWLAWLLADSRIQENPLLFGRCSEMQGYSYYIQGQIGKMLESAKIALDLARQYHDQLLEFYALRLHSIHASIRMDNNQALMYAKAALKKTQEQGLVSLEGMVLVDIGCCYMEMDCLDEAEATFSQSFLIGQKIGDQHGMATTMTYHAQLYGKRQDYETERIWLLECLIHFQATENKIHEVTVLTPLGINAVRRGAYPEARRYFLQRQQLAQQSGYMLSLIYLLADYGYLEFHEQNHEKAALLLLICQHLLHQRDALYRSHLSIEMLLPHLGQAKLDMLKRKAAFYDLERGLALAGQKIIVSVISSQTEFSKA